MLLASNSRSSRSVRTRWVAGLVVTSAPKEGSWALGYNFDQAFYVSPDDPRKRWGVFGNLGIADDNPSPVRWIANAGLAGTSPISGRTSDTFGAGYFYTGVSGALKDLAPVLLPLGNEQGAELYYNIAVTPWCHVTPDLQLSTRSANVWTRQCYSEFVRRSISESTQN